MFIYARSQGRQRFFSSKSNAVKFRDGIKGLEELSKGKIDPKKISLYKLLTNKKIILAAYFKIKNKKSQKIEFIKTENKEEHEKKGPRREQEKKTEKKKTSTNENKNVSAYDQEESGAAHMVDGLIQELRSEKYKCLQTKKLCTKDKIIYIMLSWILEEIYKKDWLKYNKEAYIYLKKMSVTFTQKEDEQENFLLATGGETAKPQVPQSEEYTKILNDFMEEHWRHFNKNGYESYQKVELFLKKK